MPPPTPSEAAFDALLSRFDPPAPQQPQHDNREAQHDNRETQHDNRETPRCHPERVEGWASDEAFFAHLFANGATYAERDPFGTIGDAPEFFSKIVGVTFEGRQDIVAGMRAGATLELRRDPANPFDPNAIGLWYNQLQLGFLRKEIARKLAPNIDSGARYVAEVTDVTGGGTRSMGVNILVRRTDLVADRPAPVARPGAVAREEIVRALIGERPIRDSQRAVLERIESRKNTLAVLGTGRGKSFCFQYPAAARAIENGERTLVLYPLRALANDQFEALVRRLGPLGLRVFRANGSIDVGERSALLAALETGAWDIICSTPEFAQYHIDRFAAHPPGLVVVDEAHHLFESKHRAAYATLGTTIAKLGTPQILALTATAGDEAFAHVRATLGIEAWVIDPTVRENLAVIEARNTTNKVAYIAERVRGEGKAIIYCNSRSAATKVAEQLRRALGNHVAFYHAGIPSAERVEIERLFREGAARVVVATSAFGEGIDLPDVRNVFLYHMNFDFTEFNQQAGRGGRDGDAAEIHLLFGSKDRSLNDFIIDRQSPPLHTLRTLYREMKKIALDDILRMTAADIADTLQIDRVDRNTVGAALRIFEEAGLLARGADDTGTYVRFLTVEGKIDLTKNARFAEGEADRENFARFCDLALNAKAADLERIINRPIYPSNVPLIR